MTSDHDGRGHESWKAGEHDEDEARSGAELEPEDDEDDPGEEEDE